MEKKVYEATLINCVLKENKKGVREAKYSTFLIL